MSKYDIQDAHKLKAIMQEISIEFICNLKEGD